MQVECNCSSHVSFLQFSDQINAGVVCNQDISTLGINRAERAQWGNPDCIHICLSWPGPGTGCFPISPGRTGILSISLKLKATSEECAPLRPESAASATARFGPVLREARGSCC